METGKLPASTHYACREIAEKLAATEAKLAHFEELAGERLVQISDDAAHIAALEKALEPFAREAAEWGNQARDDDFVRVCGQLDEDPVDSEVTVGDLRRAADLLNKEKTND